MKAKLGIKDRVSGIGVEEEIRIHLFRSAHAPTKERKRKAGAL